MNRLFLTDYRNDRLFLLTRFLLTAMIILVPVIHAAVWYSRGSIEILGFWNVTIAIRLESTTPEQLLGGYFLSLIPILIIVTATFLLLRWVTSIQKGQIFLMKNILRVKKAAVLLLIFPPVTIVQGALSSVLLSWNEPVGKRFLEIGFTGTEFISILIGLILLIVFKLLSDASHQAQELEGIV